MATVRHHEIEAWTLDIVDRVRSARPVEDDRVELKSGYGEAEKAARRLAGHLNAARGASVLWIFGVDEKAQAVPGVDAAEMDGWWRSAMSSFDELAPTVQILNVPVGGGVTVMALLVDGDRVPFVVRNPAYGQPGGGSVEREVPWREGTGVRTAHRSELIRALAPTARAPRLHLLWARAYVWGPQGRGNLSPGQEYKLNLQAIFYIEPQSPDPLIVPEHRTTALLSYGQHGVDLGCLRLHPAGIPMRFTTPSSRPPDIALTVERGAEQLLIHGPGLAQAEAEIDSHEDFGLPVNVPCRMAMRLEPVGLSHPVVLDGDLQPCTADVPQQYHVAEWAIGERRLVW